MSLTITAARWANPAQTRVLVLTNERGAVLLKPERAEWADFEAWVAAGGVVSAFTPPAIVRYLDKATIIDRMTDAELATFAAARTSTNATVRRFFLRYDALDRIPADNSQVVNVFTTAFGASRAAEILA